MTVAVVVPWAGGCPHREAAWSWVSDRYAALGLPVIEGVSTDTPFSRSQAILDGASRTDADVLVIADADVWIDDLSPAIHEARAHGWSVPHRLIHRLSGSSTTEVLAGADWHGLPLSTDNRQDCKPYKGNETGTLVVLTRDVLEHVPPDPRFVGWGQEDEAWGVALRTLIGKPWRGDADLVHLWHPPAERLNRKIGSPASKQLARRYLAARNTPDAMAALVEEGRLAWIPLVS